MEVFPSAPHLLQVVIAGISSLCHLEIHLFLGDLSLERGITARTVPAGKPLDLGNKTSHWCAGVKHQLEGAQEKGSRQSSAPAPPEEAEFDNKSIFLFRILTLPKDNETTSKNSMENLLFSFFCVLPKSPHSTAKTPPLLESSHCNSERFSPPFSWIRKSPFSSHEC